MLPVTVCVLFYTLRHIKITFFSDFVDTSKRASSALSRGQGSLETRGNGLDLVSDVPAGCSELVPYENHRGEIIIHSFCHKHSSSQNTSIPPHSVP